MLQLYMFLLEMPQVPYIFGHGDLRSVRKACLVTLVAQQKQQFDLGKNNWLNHQYYANS